MLHGECKECGRMSFLDDKHLCVECPDVTIEPPEFDLIETEGWHFTNFEVLSLFALAFIVFCLLYIKG